ncbi:MAG TPA: hypothetical protein PKM73_14560 [Verrucomicrobiota bacterium]|nr:hypothetical protein [Verrucomicrobiota bacterium]
MAMNYPDIMRRMAYQTRADERRARRDAMRERLDARQSEPAPMGYTIRRTTPEGGAPRLSMGSNPAAAMSGMVAAFRDRMAQQIVEARQRRQALEEAQTVYQPTPDGRMLRRDSSGTWRYAPSPEQLLAIGDDAEAGIVQARMDIAQAHKLPVSERLVRFGTADAGAIADENPVTLALAQSAIMKLGTGMPGRVVKAGGVDASGVPLGGAQTSGIDPFMAQFSSDPQEVLEAIRSHVGGLRTRGGDVMTDPMLQGLAQRFAMLEKSAAEAAKADPQAAVKKTRLADLERANKLISTQLEALENDELGSDEPWTDPEKAQTLQAQQAKIVAEILSLSGVSGVPANDGNGAGQAAQDVVTPVPAQNPYMRFLDEPTSEAMGSGMSARPALSALGQSRDVLSEFATPQTGPNNGSVQLDPDDYAGFAQWVQAKGLDQALADARATGRFTPAELVALYNSISR